MTLSFIRGRWTVLGATILLSLILAGCAATTPVAAPDLPSEPKAETEKSNTVDTPETGKLSAENPVVVLPPSEDLERRKELAALLPSTTDSKTESKPESKPESKTESSTPRSPGR